MEELMNTTPDPKTVRESAITDEVVREQAREIILSHAKDVEYMSIGEMIADYDEFSSLPEDEFAHVQGRIDKQIRHATVTASWPDEQPQDDGDVRAVADAVVRLKAWLTGRQANVHSEISTTNVIAEPRDRSTAAWAIAESDVRSVVAALEARDAKGGDEQ